MVVLAVVLIVESTGFFPKEVVTLQTFPHKYTTNTVFTIPVHITIISYKYRPYVGYHQQETQLPETRMTLIRVAIQWSSGIYNK
jgi:hypothetical protein